MAFSLTRLQAIGSIVAVSFAILSQAFLFMQRIDSLQERQNTVISRLDRMSVRSAETHADLDKLDARADQTDIKIQLLKCRVARGNC